MRFSIITPTYRRGELLTRAVDSLMKQTYSDWEMIIINDSPRDTSYTTFASSINDARIHYKVNEINRGVNYSRNRALREVSVDSNWIIYLDDDDYLAPDALATFRDLILLHNNRKWFITNRAQRDGTPFTKFPKPDHIYSYARDYLLLRRGKGDATHCIETKLATGVTFSKHIKQGEEWFYYYQIGLKEKIFYHDHNSTISGGYDTATGLNFRKRDRWEKLQTISRLLYEGHTLKLTKHPTFIIYIALRLIKLIIP